MLILSTPLHFLGALWRHRVDLFWPIWVAITGLGVIVVLFVIPRQKPFPRNPIPDRRGAWSRSSIFAVAFLALFLTFYIAGDLAGEEFTYYDNSLFTLGTLAGHNIPIFIWPNEGRFFPLCDQEFNLIRHVTSSIVGYHSLRIAQLVLLSLILLFLDNELGIKQRVALILLILITPSVLISFGGLIYPESNLVFSLVCFLLCVEKFGRTHSRAWAVSALVSAQFMLYYKETVFLLILGFAAARLLLRCRAGTQKGWDWRRLNEPESRLDACVAFMVVPFLLYYFAAMFPGYRTQYAKNFRVPYPEMLGTYFKIDLLAWILVAVILVRAYLILRRKTEALLLWDGMAFGALGYMAGYVVLGLQSAYYFAPADIIAVLYVGRLMLLGWAHMKGGAQSCATVLLAMVFIQDISLSSFRLYEEKNVVRAKAEIGSVIEQRFQSSPQNVRRIFFPSTETVHMMELGAYLTYRGVSIERISGGEAGTGAVMMVGESVKKDGPCVSGKPLLCHPGAEPEPGDLVVMLPDDVTQSGELKSHRQPGTEPLFSYSPWPPIPDFLMPFVRRLHVISPEFFNKPLPDGFLHASVIVWE